MSYLCAVPRELRILFIGDVVGHVGLREVVRQLPSLKERFSPDCVIVNGENIVDGKGLSEVEANELFGAGVHAITTGNHIWENWKARPLLSANPFVLRPLNYPSENPGRGWCVVTLPDQRTVGVLQLQGRVYMQPIDCPFKAADHALGKLQAKTKNIVIDFHAEATAEKIALGWYVDGRASAVLGTHTHVQTNDATILPKGTAFLTDTGMSGPYDSVLGMKKEIALRRFMTQTAHKYETATDDVRVAGVCLVLDDATGRALSIEPFMSPEPRRAISTTT
jgi:2',3'-cyclic-nucleotide 2'-phosphodiesterase